MHKLSIPETKRFGKVIFTHTQLDSTNTKASELAQAGAEEGTVVVSRIQTQGKGTGDNIWYSDPGGLYFSIILRPKLSLERVLPLTNLFVSSVAKALYSVSGLDFQTKWVNDVLINNRKIAGILIETTFQKENPDFFIVGIGINVNQTEFPLGLLATSLRLEMGKKISRFLVLKKVLLELEDDYQEFLRSTKSDHQHH